VFVWLGVFSTSLTPTEIDTILGIKCDESWLKGDFRKGTKLRESKNGWIMNSRLSEYEPVEDHVRALLDRISPYIRNFKSVLDSAHVELSVAVYMYSDRTPVLNFDKATLSNLCELGASLDIDLYNLK